MSAPTFFLPVADIDRADEIQSRAMAVLDLLGSANKVELKADTLFEVAEVLSDMVRELHSITNRQR